MTMKATFLAQGEPETTTIFTMRFNSIQRDEEKNGQKKDGADRKARQTLGTI